MGVFPQPERRFLVNRFTYLKGVVTLSLEEEKCIGCEMCTVVCPHNVFSVVDGKAVVGNRDDCMECGACAVNCPVGAIQVQKGVGCAAAVINAVLGRKNSSCCCIETNQGSNPVDSAPKGGCC
jgi:NAD-dependent dihydropyrimidine dehydrogenase PreA subunit